MQALTGAARVHMPPLRRPTLRLWLALEKAGATDGPVVTQMAGLISSQIVAQRRSSNVSVIGESSGGNLARGGRSKKWCRRT